MNAKSNQTVAKPNYSIYQYSFASGAKGDKPKTKTKLQSKSKSNQQARLPFFEFEQNMLSIDLILDIEIENHPENKFKIEFAPRSLHFTVLDLNGEDVHLLIPRLSYEIKPQRCSYSVKNQDAVVIKLVKAKPRMWETVIFIADSMKKLWFQTMREVIKSVTLKALVEPELKEIWNRAQTICTDDVNFFLNPPPPFNSTRYLHGCQSIDELIGRLKGCIKSTEDFLVKQCFLGAAVLYKLQHINSGNILVEFPNLNMQDKRVTSDPGEAPQPTNKLGKEDNSYLKEMIRKGNEFIEHKFWFPAIRCFTEAINLEPTCSAHYVNRAACYFYSDMFEQCYTEAGYARYIDPNCARAFYYMGKTSNLLGNFDLAVKHLVKARGLNTSCEEIKAELKVGIKLSQLSNDYAEMMLIGETEKALAIYDEMKENYKIKGDTWRSKNYDNLIQDGQYERVRGLARRELSDNSDAFHAKYALAKSCFYLDLKDEAFVYVEARDILQKSAGSIISPQSLQFCKVVEEFYAFREKGDRAYKKNNFTEAQKWYLRTIEVDPQNKLSNAILYYKIGDIRSKQDLQDAVKYYTLSTKFDEQNIYPLLKRIDCYKELNQIMDAILDAQNVCGIYYTDKHLTLLKDLELLLKESSIQPKNKSYVAKLQKLKQMDISKLQETEDLCTALRSLNGALIHDPSYVLFLIKRSQCLLKLKYYILSYKDAKSAIHLEPDNASACLQMGKLCNILGKGEEALAILKKCKKLDPGNRDVIRELNNAQLLTGLIMKSNKAIQEKNYKAATSILNDVVDLAVGSVELNFKRCECMIYNHSIDESSCIYIATKKLPGMYYYAEPHCLIGMSKYYSGNVKEAIDHFKKALEISPNHEKSKEFLLKTEKMLTC